MSQAQAFDRIPSDESKPSDNSCRKFSCNGCYNYILIIVFIVFIGALILANINFIDETSSRNAEIKKRLKAPSQGVATFNKMMNALSKSTIGPYSLCTPANNGCEQSCHLSNVEELNEYLEEQYQICGHALNLIVESESITTIDQNFLMGDFELESLTFDGCVLKDFGERNFDKPSMHGLKTLRMLEITTDATNFTNGTFVGLKALIHFEYIEVYSNSSILESKGFLTPLAGTLNTTIIGHTGSVTRVHRIENWFDGPKFTEMKYADFSNNSFADTLSNGTFANLPNVENLVLKNCQIGHLPGDTFGKMLETLRHLDLSHNHLKEMESSLVAEIADRRNLTVWLHGNDWNCSCEQTHFIDAIQKGLIHYSLEPVCGSPVQYRGLEIRSISLSCPNETSSTTIYCKHPDNSQSAEISVGKAEAKFSVTLSNSTSVRVEIAEAAITNVSFVLWYFTAKDECNLCKQAVRDSVVYVSDLQQGKSYVFCLLPSDGDTVSPFDCQSLYIPSARISNDVWLSKRQQPLLVSIFVLCIVLFLFLGVALSYPILRWRPTLIKGCPRLIRIDSLSPQVLLYEEIALLKSDQTKLFSDTSKTNDYMVYYKRSTIPTSTSRIRTTPEPCLPPKFIAPNKPQPSRNSDAPPYVHRLPRSESCTTNNINLEGDHLYQSLETYEEVIIDRPNRNRSHN